MTDTMILPKPPPEDPAMAMHPYDVLMCVIAGLLAPMFLTASGGDITFARMAALETVNGYRARDQSDLLVIAQIIACGLAALSSLSLSLDDDMSLAAILRLRGNAVALNRVAEQNRRALSTARPSDHLPRKSPTTDAAACAFEAADERHEAGGLADVGSAHRLVAEAAARWQNNAGPAPAPSAIPPVATLPPAAAPAKAPSHASIMAPATANTAPAYVTDLNNPAPPEPIPTSRRAALLGSTAVQAISRNPSPPRTVAALIRSSTI